MSPRHQGVKMRNNIQAIFALVLLLTVSLFAQNMCIELCTPCQNKKDQTCKKVDKRCHCTALLDSISAAQASKEAAFAESINRLSNELLQTCDEKVCARNIAFENGQFKEIKLGSSPVSKKTMQSLYETKFSSTQPEMSRIEPLPPMTEECSGFCGDCPVTDKMLKAKQPKFKDKFCKKIEQSCKCIDYAINKKQLEEQAKADSVAEFERKLQRIENSSVLAKQIQEHCSNDSACTLTVVFANSEMAALDIQRAKEIIEKKPEPIEAAIVKEKPVEEKTIEEKPVKPQEDATTPSVQKNNIWINYYEANQSNSSQNTEPNKSRSTFFGLALAFEFPESQSFNGIYFYSAPQNYDFGINAGFLFRSYFNEVVSFNIGLNAIYHIAEYEQESFYIQYSTIMAEIPLGFRFGIPLGPLPISPFISTSFHIRKPIYHWIDLEVGRYYSWIEESGDGAAAIDEWEFVPLLGVGLELSRHFAFEFQWYIGSFSIYDGGFHKTYDYGSSWRLKFEAMF